MNNMKCVFQQDDELCGEVEDDHAHHCAGAEGCPSSPKLMCHPFQWSVGTTPPLDPSAMTRLEKLLTNVRHPEDVARLKREVPALRDLPDIIVQMLYSDWSENYWAAGWLILEDEYIKEFKQYLEEEWPRPVYIG